VWGNVGKCGKGWESVGKGGNWSGKVWIWFNNVGRINIYKRVDGAITS